MVFRVSGRPWLPFDGVSRREYAIAMRQKMDIPTIDVKEYGGKQVAVVEGKVVASGRTLKEVLALARKLQPLTPLQEIKVFSVPKSLTVIYYA